MIDAVTAFILARIDEEERIARAAHHDDAIEPGSWIAESYGVEDGRPCYHVAEDRQGHYWTVGVLYEPIAEHVAQQDPRATLARCAALRELVAYLIPAYMEDVAGLILRRLAAVWSWHQDYQEEWRP